MDLQEDVDEDDYLRKKVSSGKTNDIITYGLLAHVICNILKSIKTRTDWPVKSASYFMQMRFEVNDLKI